MSLHATSQPPAPAQEQAHHLDLVATYPAYPVQAVSPVMGSAAGAVAAHAIHLSVGGATGSGLTLCGGSLGG